MPARLPEQGSRKLTIAVSVVAGALVLGAASYAIFSGDGGEDATTEPAAVAAEQAEEEPDEAAEADKAAADPDDGTPTYSADTIWTALNQSGWRRIGQIDTLEFDDLTQSSARFRKKSKTVAVTIYEANTHADAESYVTTAQKPMQAIRFGTTTVQVSPGAKGNSTQGVYDLMSTLYQLKAIAREQVEEKGD